MVRVVFSLTTIPSRLDDILPTLKSLNRQTVNPDAIYLTIPKKCKRLGVKYPDIPNKIRNLCEIVYVETDYGPLTKIVGALIKEDDPDTLIITVDDDIIYPKTLVKEFIYWNSKYKNCALSSSGLIMGEYPFKYSLKFNQKRNDWWFTMNTGRNIDILYGYPGALYLRKFFPVKHRLARRFLKHVLINDDLFKNDDIYISMYLNRNGIKRKLVKISEVYNCSGNDALSQNVFNFFTSLNRAANECEKLGWFKTKESTNPTETLGSVVIIVLVLILLFIFILTSVLENI